MEDLGNSDSSAFVYEGEIEPIVVGAIEAHVKDKQYDEANVQHWINYICEDVMQGLALLGKPFKYAVNCVIMQNTGAGVHAHISEYLDGMNDGVGICKWPPEKIAKEQPNLYCIVTVYGFAIFAS